jgi:hypothetical protein
MAGKYGSRKFLLAAFAWIIGTTVWLASPLYAKPLMTADQWIEFSKWIIGLYIAGNASTAFAPRDAK